VDLERWEEALGVRERHFKLAKENKNVVEQQRALTERGGCSLLPSRDPCQLPHKHARTRTRTRTRTGTRTDADTHKHNRQSNPTLRSHDCTCLHGRKTSAVCACALARDHFHHTRTRTHSLTHSLACARTLAHVHTCVTHSVVQATRSTSLP
jgi:hypothetical protein